MKSGSTKFKPVLAQTFHFLQYFCIQRFGQYYNIIYYNHELPVIIYHNIIYYNTIYYIIIYYNLELPSIILPFHRISAVLKIFLLYTNIITKRQQPSSYTQEAFSSLGNFLKQCCNLLFLALNILIKRIVE